ncbi:MAG TPA: molybdenum cofactor guanylyltransferase [Pseudomonadales bacterium]
MFYAAVLAGGKSSRMGQDKSRLVLGERTLLERAVALLHDTGAELVLVGGGKGANAVPDLLPHSGPPGGLYSLLDHIRLHYGLDGSPLLLIPVDMPLLTVPTLQRLLGASVNASCCHFEDEIFPCVIKATPDLYTHLRDLFNDGTELGGSRSMHGVFSYLGAKVVGVEGISPDEFRNTNTPEDWQRVLETQHAGEKKGR